MTTASGEAKEDLILNGVMGLCGEAGECIDIVKKNRFQGHGLDREKLLDEASDCLWYLAEIASGLGVALEDIARHNVEKLKKRYPNGFEAERSVNKIP
jgi:NTP pyrophosphatase (non-canonical NTP hydrolase)